MVARQNKEQEWASYATTPSPLPLSPTPPCVLLGLNMSASAGADKQNGRAKGSADAAFIFDSETPPKKSYASEIRCSPARAVGISLTRSSSTKGNLPAWPLCALTVPRRLAFLSKSQRRGHTFFLFSEPSFMADHLPAHVERKQTPPLACFLFLAALFCDRVAGSTLSLMASPRAINCASSLLGILPILDPLFLRLC